MKKVIYILFAAILLLPVATHAAATKEDGSFDVKATLFGHLLDHYEWEVPLTPYVIHLPVIVRDYQGEWNVFSSKHLSEGKTHNNFQIAKEGEHEGKIVGLDDLGNMYRPTDFSITRNVMALFVTAFIMCLCIFPLVRFYKREKYYKAPRKGLGFMELAVSMIYFEMIRPIVGAEAKRFAPYLLTIFFFILTANLLGLIVVFPAGTNLTGNISITLALALCTFVVVNVMGTKEYWKEIFWPDVPTWLKIPIPIIPFIEFFGVFTKPAALTIRLFANMMGGHLIILVLISLIFIFASLGNVVLGATTVISVVFSVFMTVIDILISFIQAYVFTMLSALFISMARVQHHPKEKQEEI